MKVKINSSELSILKDTVGRIVHHYGAGIVTFLSDDGVRVNLHKSHLIDVDDTPQIEVGSEWVSGEGNVYTVKYASDKTVVYGEDDLCAYTDEFIKLLKPKPKTVTMYFYKTPHGYVAYSEHHPFDTLAFTKEIEL